MRQNRTIVHRKVSQMPHTLTLEEAFLTPKKADVYFLRCKESNNGVIWPQPVTSGHPHITHPCCECKIHNRPLALIEWGGVWATPGTKTAKIVV